MNKWLEALQRLNPNCASNYSVQWCEALVLRVFRKRENRKTSSDDDEVAGWLKEVKKQNPQWANQLTKQEHLIRVKQAIDTQAVSTQSEYSKVTYYLNQIQDQNQAIANQLSEQYCVNQLELVIQELETTSNLHNEQRAHSLLKKLNTLNSTHYQSYSLRLNEIKAERVIKALETGHHPEEENQVAGYLNQLYLGGSSHFASLAGRYNTIKTKQVIQAMVAGNRPPEEKNIPRWLAVISNMDTMSGRLFSLHHRTALAMRALKVSGEVKITPHEEAELQRSLSEFKGQDRAQPALACWASFQAERVILKIKAGNEHQNEDRMTEFLSSIHLQDEDKAAEYYASWVAARITRMLLALEAKRESCDKAEMEGLLAELQKYDVGQTDHLRKRWHAARQMSHGNLQINHAR